MSEAKHTPGPWKRDTIEAGATSIAVHNDGADDIAEVYLTSTDDEGIEEAKANAHLIAAAPEMLDILKLWDKGYDSESKADWIDQGIEAKRLTAELIERIAKANG